MRMVSEKRLLTVSLTVGLVLWLLLPGCHGPQQSTRTGRPCPVCKRQTRALPVARLTYTTCVCPLCRNVTTLDASTRTAVEICTGATLGGPVEVCSHCQIIAERCAACRKSLGKPAGP